MSTPVPVSKRWAAWLRQIGVHNLEDLAELGSVEAFLRCRRVGFRASLNMLYALEAAQQGCSPKDLPEARRDELREQAEQALEALAAGEPPAPVRVLHKPDPDSL